MSIQTKKFPISGLLFAIMAIGSAQKSDAAFISYQVSLDTAFLATAMSTYYLDFQFAAGDSSEPFPNTVIVTSNTGQFAPFNLTAGLPPFTGELTLPFTPADPTTFTLTFTDYETPETPDLLSIYVLDSSFDPVETTDPSGNNTLVSFSESLYPDAPGIDPPLSFDTVTADFNTQVSFVPAPEPGTIALAGFILLFSIGSARYRKPQTQK